MKPYLVYSNSTIIDKEPVKPTDWRLSQMTVVTAQIRTTTKVLSMSVVMPKSNATTFFSRFFFKPEITHFDDRLVNMLL